MEQQGQIGTGLLGVDLPGDIRDISYDVKNWEWSWSHAAKTTLDAVGVLPVVGALKYTDEAASLLKGGAGNAEKIFWGSWSDYAKVTANGQEYAKVGERLY